MLPGEVDAGHEQVVFVNHDGAGVSERPRIRRNCAVVEARAVGRGDAVVLDGAALVESASDYHAPGGVVGVSGGGPGLRQAARPSPRVCRLDVAPTLGEVGAVVVGHGLVVAAAKDRNGACA